MKTVPIVFRDEWLVAIDKPAGMLVHARDVPQADDQVAMKILRDQLGESIHVLHRLDQPTTGVVLFATNRKAARKIRRDFEKRRIEKNYLAIVHGHPSEDKWTCNEPLRKPPDGKEKAAETSFKVMNQLAGNFALLEALPTTGRYHQIRRHLFSSGHPVVGDFRYLDEEFCHQVGDGLGIGTRMLLQARSLKLRHPIVGTDIVIEAPLDKAMAGILKKQTRLPDRETGLHTFEWKEILTSTLEG